jgi:hypothetical protein
MKEMGLQITAHGNLHRVIRWLFIQKCGALKLCEFINIRVVNERSNKKGRVRLTLPRQVGGLTGKWQAFF